MPGREALYTAAQSRALDRCAIDEHGIPGIRLMARAAAAAFAALLAAWPEVRRLQVLCGTGNNGGDGYLIADLAHQRGIAVTVLQLGDAAKIRGDAASAREQALQHGVPVRPFDGQPLEAAGVVVDAMLGTGLGGEVRAPYRTAIDAINACPVPVLAVDIPSGLCADSGRVLGCAVRAERTVTFIGRKRGLFTMAAADHAGDVVFDDLGVPAGVYRTVAADCHRVQLEPLLSLLPPRPATAHKGLYGTVLVLGGDYGMAGAAALAAEAALRCGAGLVQVVTRPEHVAALVARTPEAMPRALTAEGELAPLLAAADVLVVGPGLGQSAWARDLLSAALDSGKPAVLDADALNLIAAAGEPVSAPHCLLTPHPGEAARLLGTSTAAVQADRFAAVRELQSRYGGVALLKGSGTLVAGPGEVLVSNYGNPGMASGGMGDVLSGVLGALLAQQLPALSAAALGACLHGAAADRAAARGQRGLLASDLMPHLRALLQ